jgi:hypothetical protein
VTLPLNTMAFSESANSKPVTLTFVSLMII